MNKFVESIDNMKLTENGDLAYKSTLSANLDLFSFGGAYRSRLASEIRELVDKAWAEGDPDLTLKLIYYLRDIRGGVSERRVPRIALEYVLDKKVTDAKDIRYLVSLIPEYGRWDDVVWIGTTTLNSELSKICFEVIKAQFLEDISTDKPSLLGKWMPSENTSSPRTRANAKKLREYLGLTERTYRKSLSSLRSKINIVETLMSKSEWSQISYSTVPSQAMLRYRNAFNAHDGNRYQEYLDSVKKGEKKINTSTLFPYQIVSSLYKDIDHNCYASDEEINSLEVLWNNLPDYINEANQNSLVVCDVSGSMLVPVSGKVTAMDVSTSLALYFAERCTGDFRDRFITFSANPDWHVIEGVNLKTKIENIFNADWGGSTNLVGVFDLILLTATRNKVPESDMPKCIYVITDMEFDPATSWTGYTPSSYEMIKDKYREAGYELPHLVFWNVNARNNTVPVTRNEIGTTLVSGLSPVIFSFIVEGRTPKEFMLSVVGSERYSQVHLNA